MNADPRHRWDVDPLTVWPAEPARQSRRRSAVIAALCVLACAVIVAVALYLEGVK